MMRRFLATIILSFISFSSSAQEIILPLNIGEVRKFSSTILKEERTLNIYLPPDFDSTLSYPVIYLLDGSMNEDFLHLMGLVQFFNLQLAMPPSIIVGIANVDRKRDFTFHTDDKELKKDFPTTGHSAPLISFIEKELQPYIQNSFKTNSTKYIVGQSLGGLLATEVLTKKPQLFTHYLIVSPSLWWDNESLLKTAETALPAQKEFPEFVYISVGAGEEKIMQDDAKKLFDLLKKTYPSKTNLHFNLMKKENHATILHNSIYEGLYLLYPYKAPAN